MARIAGVDLPREKRGEVALTYIYGIGRPTAMRVLKQAHVDHNKRVKTWSEDETGRVREILEREIKVEGDLRREISMNVKRDRKSTRLNSSHGSISYAVFCL